MIEITPKTKEVLNKIGFIGGVSFGLLFVFTGGDISTIQGKVTAIMAFVSVLFNGIRELMK